MKQTIKFLFILMLSFSLYSCGGDEDEFGTTFGIRNDREMLEYETLAINGGSYVVGTEYPDFKAIGAVKAGEAEGSGTLINSEWVVTAAHNIVDTDASMPNVADISFIIGADFDNPELSITASEIFVHPGWLANLETGSEEGVDIALIHLSTPITSVTPFSVYFGDNDAINSKVFVAGYGDYAEFMGVDRYTKRHAFENILDRKLSNLSTTNSYTDDNLYKGGVIACDFDSPENTTNTLGIDAIYESDMDFLSTGTSDNIPLYLEGTSVTGDSGGATLMSIDGNWKLIGVVSYGNTNSEYGDISVYTRIASHSAWITSITGIVK